MAAMDRLGMSFSNTARLGLLLNYATSDEARSDAIAWIKDHKVTFVVSFVGAIAVTALATAAIAITIFTSGLPLFFTLAIGGSLITGLSIFATCAISRTKKLEAKQELEKALASIAAERIPIFHQITPPPPQVIKYYQDQENHLPTIEEEPPLQQALPSWRPNLLRAWIGAVIMTEVCIRSLGLD